MGNIIGIDPGNVVSGLCMIEDGKVVYANVFENNKLVDWMYDEVAESSVQIAIEDIVPYTGKMKPQTIDTCKWIGELTYRLKINGFKNIKFIPRSNVRNWIYKTVPDICTPKVIKRMIALDKIRVKQGLRGLRNASGELRKPSFHYVDDRIVIAAVKELYNIPTPKPGKVNIYGLKDHSWQALATAMFLESNPDFEPAPPKIKKKKASE